MQLNFALSIIGGVRGHFVQQPLPRSGRRFGRSVPARRSGNYREQRHAAAPIGEHHALVDRLVKQFADPVVGGARTNVKHSEIFKPVHAHELSHEVGAVIAGAGVLHHEAAEAHSLFQQLPQLLGTETLGADSVEVDRI